MNKKSNDGYEDMVEMDATEVMERWSRMNEMDDEPQLTLEEIIEKKVQEVLALKEKPAPKPKTPAKKTTKKKTGA